MIFFLSVLIISLAVNSPFLLSMMIIVLALSLSLHLGMMFSKWLFVSLMMVYLGGMMVLVFYIVSLSKPAKLNFLPAKYWAVMATSLTMEFNALSLTIMDKTFMLDLYTYTGFQTLLILSFYLFLCLVYIVKICQNFKGSLMMSW